MAENPMGPLTRLYRQLRAAAERAGLELQEFDARPNPITEQGPHYTRAAFTLKEDFDPAPKEEDELDKMLAAQAAEEERRRQEEARKGLAGLIENLEQGKGIL